MYTSKIIKAHCKHTGQYFIIEAEKSGVVFFASKFYPITNDIARTIKSEISPLALQTNSELPKCSVCGSRRVGHGHDDSHKCSCEKSKDNKQCIYCGGLVYDDIGETDIFVKTKEEHFDVFFVMDASGSMYGQLKNAANATRALIKDLEKLKNTYYFIPFASTFKYLIKNEMNIDHINSALLTYQSDKSNVGAGTNGRVMDFIKDDIINSKRPVRVIIVTDGQWDEQARALTIRNEIINKKQDIEIVAIGIGAAKNSFLQQLGTIKEFSKVIDSGKLENTFMEISKMLRTK